MLPRRTPKPARARSALPSLLCVLGAGIAVEFGAVSEADAQPVPHTPRPPATPTTPPHAHPPAVRPTHVRPTPHVPTPHPPQMRPAGAPMRVGPIHTPPPPPPPPAPPTEPGQIEGGLARVSVLPLVRPFVG